MSKFRMLNLLAFTTICLALVAGTEPQVKHDDKDLIARLRKMEETQRQSMATLKEQLTLISMKLEQNQACCQKVDSFVKTQENTHVNVCPIGYLPYAKSCYRLVKTMANWTTASEKCHADGGHLVSIETRDEDAFLWSLIQHNKATAGGRQVWTGGHQQTPGGPWMWGKTAAMLGYTNWQAGQPDDYQQIEDCLLLGHANKPGWNDGRCSFMSYYICERKRIY